MGSANYQNLLTLLHNSPFDSKSYTQLVDYLERTNQNDKADEVFIKMKRREVVEKCAWWDPCCWYKLIVGWSNGYGRDRFRVVWLSLVVIAVGCFVFNDEYLQPDDSQEKDPSKDKNPLMLRFLLSLDFFLPMLPQNILNLLPQKLADMLPYRGFELGYENSWKPPGRNVIRQAYIVMHKMFGWLFFSLASIRTLVQIIDKFLFG